MYCKQRKLIFIFLFFALCIYGQQEFSNPIIKGGYPDPSICKVDDTFYIVNSSFEYFPGLPIHKSKDLINWDLIGYGLHQESQVNSVVNLIDVQSDGGIHAPTIRYNNGTFYIISTNVYFDEKKQKAEMINFIITAKNPEGPWSEPKHILDAPGIDPDLFFDDDGRVWYVGNQQPEDPNFDGEGEIWVQEIDLQKFVLVGERHLLWRGACGGVWAEGPHMYKKDSKYYLLIAEGGTSFNHAVMVALSDKIEGPYISNPRNPILTSRNLSYDNWVNSTGHGDIVRLDDGRYYMVLLGIRNEIDRGSNMGRETFIVPVSWEREPYDWKKIKYLWPVVAPETGRVELQNQLIFDNSNKIISNGFIDDFNSEILNLNWNFRRFPMNNIFQIDSKKGLLNLFCNKNIIKERGRAALMGFKQTETSFEYRAKMFFNPKDEGSEAGVSMFQKDNNYINFTLIKQNDNILVQINAIKDGVLEDSFVSEINNYKGQIEFKVTASKSKYKLSYSLNGKEFIFVKSLDYSIIKSNGYTGAHLGVYASGNGQISNDYASFDYVNYLIKTK